MGEALKAAKAHDPCCSTPRLAERGCSVRLPQPTRSWRCLSGTKYQVSHAVSDALCDGIFVSAGRGEERLIAIEMKSGRPDVGKAVKQLQGGANLLQELADGAEQIEFRAMLAHRGLGAIEVALLRRTRIQFRGQRYMIETPRCGTSLAA
jgi:hypothetical protein